MIIKTAICDDEKKGIEIICALLEKYEFTTDVEFKKSIYTNPDDLLKDYKTSGLYNLIFLDVEMPINGVDRNGIDTAKKIRSIPDHDVRIVYLSNYPSYMHMSFDVQASHYLEKSISFERFKTVMDTIIQGLTDDSDMMRIKTGSDQWNLIRIKDIICVRSFIGQRERLAFCTANGEMIGTGKSILTLGTELNPHHFIFANKNCLVNMRHVVQFSHDTLQLSNTECVEISRHFRKAFTEQFSKNILNI